MARPGFTVGGGGDHAALAPLVDARRHLAGVGRDRQPVVGPAEVVVPAPRGRLGRDSQRQGAVLFLKRGQAREPIRGVLLASVHVEHKDPGGGAGGDAHTGHGPAPEHTAQLGRVRRGAPAPPAGVRRSGVALLASLSRELEREHLPTQPSEVEGGLGAVLEKGRRLIVHPSTAPSSWSGWMLWESGSQK